MNNSIKLSIGIGLGIIIASALMFYSFMSGQYGMAVGSIGEQGYMSTTTSGTTGSTWTGATTTKVGSGIFGSVIVTKAFNSQVPLVTLNIYDATTTNVNLRTGNLATSSILLASFGTTTPVGTYVFDTEFKNGLTIDPTPINGGVVASTTITWKF